MGHPLAYKCEFAISIETVFFSSHSSIECFAMYRIECTMIADCSLLWWPLEGQTNSIGLQCISSEQLELKSNFRGNIFDWAERYGFLFFIDWYWMKLSPPGVFSDQLRAWVIIVLDKTVFSCSLSKNEKLMQIQVSECALFIFFRSAWNLHGWKTLCKHQIKSASYDRFNVASKLVSHCDRSDRQFFYCEHFFYAYVIIGPLLAEVQDENIHFPTEYRLRSLFSMFLFCCLKYWPHFHVVPRRTTI